jgi:hypothetical protein
MSSRLWYLTIADCFSARLTATSSGRVVIVCSPEGEGIGHNTHSKIRKG